ncbi:MAG: GNAT family N-acetyltransferase [Qipengyuania sp.]|jgi:RimJ/RimL family protein N-acetyltransferase|nr:GNAT family N-acetyltransferase [Qipengyuania sp.]
MDRQPTLEDERLLLRPLRPDDWGALWTIASDRELWAVHPANDRWREPVFREFFADALAQGGALAAIEKSTGRVIGSSRFQEYEPANASGHGGSVEIGWTFLARDHWGGGYNAEMKRLMLAHALASVERAVFVVGEDNVVSRRAMEKIGGHLTGERRVKMRAGRPLDHVIFEIDRAGFARGPLSGAGSPCAGDSAPARRSRD